MFLPMVPRAQHERWTHAHQRAHQTTETSRILISCVPFQNGGGGVGVVGSDENSLPEGGGGEFFPLIEAPHGIKTSDITTLGDFH